MDAQFEVERKFLVREPPANCDPATGVEITQGYLTIGDGQEVRVRRKGAVCSLTVKKGSGLVREEYEVQLEPEQLEGLWPATVGQRVEKIRYKVPLGPFTAEVDLYSGDLAGLLTVEVEFSSVDEAANFDPPSWFGAELTEDPRYANRWLAVDGLPD